jgi:hypothetical protein
MLLVAILAPLVAAVAMQARLDLMIERHGHAALEAFYVAESGLEHALADLAHDPSFERLSKGPDGERDTADDRLYPFSSPPPAYFPAPPAGYRVETAPVGDGVIEIISYGRSLLRSSRRVATTAIKSDQPYLPAALYSGGDAVLLALGDDFYVAGADETGDDDTPAVALDDEADVDVLLQYLWEPARQRLRGPGGPPSVKARRLRSLGGMSAALAAVATAQFLDGDVQGPLGWGIALVPRSSRVSDASGGGILVVDGNLSIAGHFEFQGLVIVRGDVDLDPDGSLDLKGSLLQESPGHILRLDGSGEIRYDPAVLALVDALAPGVLPHRAFIGAWRERP